MLQWIDDRWHCDGRPIHAGNCLELRGDGGHWIPVRVESRDQGRELIAFYRVHGREFCSGIETDYDKLRWPP